MFSVQQEKLQWKNEELLQLKQMQIEKYNILTTLHEEINAIDNDQKHHQKSNEKHSGQQNNQLANDLQRLIDISGQQKLQINRIIEDIHELRMKTSTKYSADSPLNEKVPDSFSFV